jgi:hypothetical protein
VTPESPLATVLRLLTGTTAGPGGCMLWAGATSKKRRGQRRPSCRHGGRTRNPAHVILEAHAERWPCEGGAWVAAGVWLADPEPAEQAPPAVAAIPGMAKGCGETQERGGRTHTCTAHVAHADGTATHLDEATSASWLIRTGGRP